MAYFLLLLPLVVLIVVCIWFKLSKVKPDKDDDEKKIEQLIKRQDGDINLDLED